MKLLTNEVPSPMYPTDEREEWTRKRKENKEKGIEVKKKVKIVEEHHDDCGTNLSGLGDIHMVLSVYLPSDNDDEPLVADLCNNWLKGSDWFGDTFNTTTRTMESVFHMMHTLDHLDDGIDMVELCGGEGRTSILAVRRQLKVGENFDLVTSWDLNDPTQQELVRKYFRKYRPLVAIMGPTCKPFGKLANYNYWHNHEAWLRSYHEAAPHGRFCGEIACVQDDNSRYYLCENPKDSWLFQEEPWPNLM